MPTELAGDAHEIARAEALAVQAHARGEQQARYGELVAAVDAGAVAGDDETLLESILELALQTGRVRALYGPGGEQAVLATLRTLPRGRERAQSARDVSNALAALAGRTLDSVQVRAVAPGAFTLSIEAGGAETSVRLDATGARLASVGL
jgi:hypothetical protein